MTGKSGIQWKLRSKSMGPRERPGPLWRSSVVFYLWLGYRWGSYTLSISIVWQLELTQSICNFSRNYWLRNWWREELPEHNYLICYWVGQLLKRQYLGTLKTEAEVGILTLPSPRCDLRQVKVISPGLTKSALGQCWYIWEQTPHVFAFYIFVIDHQALNTVSTQKIPVEWADS